MTSFAQNIGLVAMTKVVNRKVILSGGLILVIASFVPAVAEVFNSLPQAVLGGCTIMMFGNIILSGFQMISEAGYTQRNITIGGVESHHRYRFHAGRRHFRQLPAAVPVHLRIQLHRRGVRCGRAVECSAAE